MTRSCRLWAVAGLLAAAAFISSSTGAKKATSAFFPADGGQPGDVKPADDVDSALAKSKFADGGIQAYQPLQGERLFAWQLKPDLGQPVARPRDILIMVSTTATQAGVNFIGGQQLAEAVMKNAGPNDRVSLWMVSTPKEQFTRSLRLPEWLSRFLLRFDMRELHHMYVHVPGYYLQRIPYSAQNEVNWLDWTRQAKHTGGCWN